MDEFKVVRVSSGDAENALEDELNGAALAGYELVTVVAAEHLVFGVFSRPRSTAPASA